MIEYAIVHISPCGSAMLMNILGITMSCCICERDSMNPAWEDFSQGTHGREMPIAQVQ